MNKKLYVLSKKKYSKSPYIIENVSHYMLGDLAVFTALRTIPKNEVKLIFNMYRFGSKEFDNILELLKSSDKDSINLAIEILRNNNCIIYEKRT